MNKSYKPKYKIKKYLIFYIFGPLTVIFLINITISSDYNKLILILIPIAIMLFFLVFLSFAFLDEIKEIYCENGNIIVKRYFIPNEIIHKPIYYIIGIKILQ
jgi:hypothetical protein